MITELMNRRYMCRHVVNGDICNLAGQENKRPTMAQDGLSLIDKSERPVCRIVRTIVEGTSTCDSCPMKCAATIKAVRRALEIGDPVLREGTVKTVLRNACCGWQPRPPVSNRLPGGAP